MRFQTIIGLEVHAQLKTASKMFCGCPIVEDGSAPNTAICPVCTGQPGALPALNQKAVELGVKAGLALGCRIPELSAFDRKNYFYPDLPKGYQISQYHRPVAVEGALEIRIPKGALPGRERVTIGITRAHLEEDAAKNVHAGEAAGHERATYVDYNRASVPLLEIVSEPEIRSPAEAKAYLQELRAILRATHVSDADMEKGQMRCDANVSLMPVDEEGRPTQAGFNPKVEIKNLNSFRAVERAIAYEVERQTKMLEAGQVPQGATRGWDENRGETFDQRAKETNADYRYFPEPDLPPQKLDELRSSISTRMPELPRQTEERLMNEWGFSADTAAVLVANDWSEYADHVMGELGGWMESTDDASVSGGEQLAAQKAALAKLVGGWLTSKLAGILAEKGLTLTDARIDAEDFAEFINLLHKGEVNSANGLKLLTLMVETHDDPSHLLERHNLGQNMDDAALAEIVRQVVANNPGQADEVRGGKIALLKWFVGAIMKASDGRANPEKAEQAVKKELGV